MRISAINLRSIQPLVLFLVLATIAAHGDVKLPGIFGDHMVLQEGKTLPVWGAAGPGEKVTVTIGADSASATTGADGKWRIDLKPLPMRDTATTLTVAGKNTVTFQDVVVGEVWLASGQSNMELRVADLVNMTPEPGDQEPGRCEAGGRRCGQAPVDPHFHRRQKAGHHAARRRCGRPMAGLLARHHRQLLGRRLFLRAGAGGETPPAHRPRPARLGWPAHPDLHEPGIAAVPSFRDKRPQQQSSRTRMRRSPSSTPQPGPPRWPIIKPSSRTGRPKSTARTRPSSRPGKSRPMPRKPPASPSRPGRPNRSRAPSPRMARRVGPPRSSTA